MELRGVTTRGPTTTVALQTAAHGLDWLLTDYPLRLLMALLMALLMLLLVPLPPPAADSMPSLSSWHNP
jgi:hypothetical protein